MSILMYVTERTLTITGLIFTCPSYCSSAVHSVYKRRTGIKIGFPQHLRQFYQIGLVKLPYYSGAAATS